jgi:hypothetical protein
MLNDLGDLFKMSLTGYLSEYSLAEIFNFVQDGNKTGLLSIESDRCLSRSLDNSYYISFQTWRIMSEQLTGLSININKLGQPLGTYLKACNTLDSSQLRLLFDAQVVANICKLFGDIHHGRFDFNPQAPLIYAEMTGISLHAKEVSLLGLRMLRDWSSLSAKLPTPASLLQRVSSTLPDLRLDSQESKVWSLALGELSIAKIAEHLGLKIDRVQQIGFRLCAIGLVEEVLPVAIVKPIELQPAGNSHPPTIPISTSFLGKLMGFLKKK